MYDNANNAVPNMTRPIGRLTTSTAYRAGQAYTSQQKGFNLFGDSLGVTITIPAAEGALAGTYTFGRTYTATVGLPLFATFPAATRQLPPESLLAPGRRCR